MKEYTTKEMRLLKSNPYTFKVTKNKLYFTVEFKEAFWIGYQAGTSPRKLLSELGYDTEIFGKFAVISLLKEKEKRRGHIMEKTENKYLRQEVEFLKKIVKLKNAKKEKS